MSAKGLSIDLVIHGFKSMDNKFSNRLKQVKGARARLEQVCQAELSCFLMKSLDP